MTPQRPQRCFQMIKLLLLTATLLGCAGCGVLQIEVDVYKGPLSNNEDVQTEQVAAMAIAAKPLLIELRRTMFEAKNPDGTKLDDLLEPLDRTTRFVLPGTYVYNNGESEQEVFLFEDTLAGRVNSVLYLYENKLAGSDYPNLSILLSLIEEIETTIPKLNDVNERMTLNQKDKAARLQGWPAMAANASDDLKQLNTVLKAFVTGDKIEVGGTEKWPTDQIFVTAKALASRDADIFTTNELSAINTLSASDNTVEKFKKLKDTVFVQSLVAQLSSNKKSQSLIVRSVTGYASDFLTRRELSHTLLTRLLLFITEFDRVAEADDPLRITGLSEIARIAASLISYHELRVSQLSEIRVNTGHQFIIESLLSEKRTWQAKRDTMRSALINGKVNFTPSELARELLEIDRRYVKYDIDAFGISFNYILNETGQNPLDELSESLQTFQSLSRELNAGGFERGRLKDGLEEMTEAYLKARDISQPDLAQRQELEHLRQRLHGALVRFAQKVLFIADNEVLFGDRNRGDKQTKDQYVRMMQAVGNSILTQIDEMKHREDFNNPSRLERLGHIEASGTIAAPPGADEVFVHLIDKIDEAALIVGDDKKRALGPFPNEPDKSVLEQSKVHIEEYRVAIIGETPKASRVAVVEKLLDPLADPTQAKIKAILEYYRDHHPMPSAGIGKKNYVYNKDPRSVIDEEIAGLRHRYINALEKFGESSKQAMQLKDAIDAAAEFRQSMVHLRPPSAYLRNSYPATTLQASGSGRAWENLLLRHGVRQIPFAGLLSGDEDLKTQAEIDKQFWQNINTVRVAGGGLTNYVVTKDDLGNWYVKNYEASPKPIIEGAAGLAGLYMTGGLDPSNVKALRDGVAPATSGTSLGKLQTNHAEEGDTLEQTLRTKAATLPGELKEAWKEMDGFMFKSDKYANALQEQADNKKIEVAEAESDEKKVQEAVNAHSAADASKQELQKREEEVAIAKEKLKNATTDEDKRAFEQAVQAAESKRDEQKIKDTAAQSNADTARQLAGIDADKDLNVAIAEAQANVKKKKDEAEAAQKAADKANTEGVAGKLDADTLDRLNKVLDEIELELPKDSDQISPTNLLKAMQNWRQRVIEQINKDWKKPYKVTAEYGGETYQGEIEDTQKVVKPVSDRTDTLVGAVIEPATKDWLDKVKAYQQKLDVVAETID